MSGFYFIPSGKNCTIDINATELSKLENIFEYNRNPQAIKELRQQVENHEKALKEQAQRLEQARFKEAEAERLKNEAEELKRR